MGRGRRWRKEGMENWRGWENRGNKGISLRMLKYSRFEKKNVLQRELLKTTLGH
jgi:hypothetical protein